MLDANLKTALKGYLERLVQPIEIVTYADASENSRQMLELVGDVASVAPAGRLSVR
ncbi:MAG: alkyl hydroperoxide reductase subunit, partial [Pseudomonadota bacterium]